MGASCNRQLSFVIAFLAQGLALLLLLHPNSFAAADGPRLVQKDGRYRSEEHTSELQSPKQISYAVFCLKKKTHV